MNFDKTLVGLLILGLTHPLLVNRDEWMKMLKDSIPRIVKLISILVFLDTALTLLQLYPLAPVAYSFALVLVRRAKGADVG